MTLESKSVRLRYVEENDARFILSLRLDDRYSKYLSSVSPDVNSQKKWIRSYKESEAKGEQFYFIIERLDGVPCGTVRVYDLRSDSFCWGSWILNEKKPRYAAIETAFLVYQFGFDQLGFYKSHFDVMKKNSGVLKFHRRMGAVETGEDDDNIYFIITKDEVEQAKSKLENKIR